MLYQRHNFSNHIWEQRWCYEFTLSVQLSMVSNALNKIIGKNDET